MAVIFVLSSIEGSGYYSGNIFLFLKRKFFHIIEYFILTVLFFSALSQSRKYDKALLFSAILAFFYGISDEWHQTFVFGREGKVRDVAIDLAGIILALSFISLFRKWKSTKK